MSKKETTKKNRSAPAATLEAREEQLIALAVDQAEEQMRNGTASSQIISHFLKLATTRAQLEKEKLSYETELIKAKTESIQAQKREDEFYEKVLNAMKIYSGHDDE